jgi:hypothetical protein
MPLVVPPSPTKCFAQAATFFLQKQERKREKGRKIRRTKKKRQIKCMFRTVEHKMQVAISRSTVEKG